MWARERERERKHRPLFSLGFHLVSLLGCLGNSGNTLSTRFNQNTPKIHHIDQGFITKIPFLQMRFLSARRFKVQTQNSVYFCLCWLCCRDSSILMRVVVVVVLFCFLDVLIIVLHNKWYRSSSRVRRKRQEEQSRSVDLLGSRRKKERKKERKLGVRDVVDFFLHTKDWSLGAFFFFLGHRLSSGDAFDYSQLVEVMF